MAEALLAAGSSSVSRSQEHVAEDLPDGTAARVGMFSARFDGEEPERLFREVHKILKNKNYPVLMVDAPVGADFGTLTEEYLGKLKFNKGVLLSVCTSHYGAVTKSVCSSHHELKFAHVYGIDILPLKMCDMWPPEPYADCPRDENADLVDGLLSSVFLPTKVHMDCQGKDAHWIAAHIAKVLHGPREQFEDLAKKVSVASNPGQKETSMHVAALQNGDSVYIKVDGRDLWLWKSYAENAVVGPQHGRAVFKVHANMSEEFIRLSLADSDSYLCACTSGNTGYDVFRSGSKQQQWKKANLRYNAPVDLTDLHWGHVRTAANLDRNATGYTGVAGTYRVESVRNLHSGHIVKWVLERAALVGGYSIARGPGQKETSMHAAALQNGDSVYIKVDGRDLWLWKSYAKFAVVGPQHGRAVFKVHANMSEEFIRLSLAGSDSYLCACTSGNTGYDVFRSGSKQQQWKKANLRYNAPVDLTDLHWGHVLTAANLDRNAKDRTGVAGTYTVESVRDLHSGHIVNWVLERAGP